MTTTAEELARLRVWAAQVRDDGHDDLKDDARTICCLLDLADAVASEALAALARENARTLEARIRKRARG